MDEMAVIQYLLTSGGGAGAGVIVTYQLMSSRMKRIEDDQRDATEGQRQCKEVCMARINTLEKVQHDMELKILNGINELKLDLTTMKADISIVKNQGHLGESIRAAVVEVGNRLVDRIDTHTREIQAVRGDGD